MTHLDLFSGIGGFALAAQWAGFETIGFCEIDPYATRVLAKHWPGVPSFGDIRNMRGVSADLITGGFPCQPYSCAGKRRGAEDDRALWPEMRRVIEESGAAWVVAENVPGIIGMELDNVLSDLESLGYSCGTLLIPACAVDAGHRRNRVWIVAYAERAEWRPHNELRGCASQRQNGEGQAASRTGKRGEILADASGKRRQQITRGSHGDESANEGRSTPCDNQSQCNGEGVRAWALANAESEQRNWSERDSDTARREGFTNGCQWLSEPDVGRVANGIPSRVDRLKGLGNAIVPQVAYQILKAITMTIRGSKKG